MKNAPGGSDIVIVGGGMSGLAVASVLAKRSDASIVVLEGGPDAGRAHIRQTNSNDDALNLWLYPESDPHFWRPYETDGSSYLGLSGLRRRLGGRSLYWGGAFLPIEHWALDDAWPASVVRDLTDTWRGGPSLYAQVAADMASWAGTVSEETPDTLTIGDAVFRPTPHATRKVGGRSIPYSPLEHIPPSAASPQIVPLCQALGVLTEGGRVSAVRVRQMDRVFDISTRHVVLAGGTIENSRLAIQSLNTAGNLDDCRLPGLVDKIAYGFNFFCPAEAVDPMLRRAAELGTTFHRHLDPALKSNHFVRLWTRPDGAISFDTWLMGEQERTEASVVYCTPGEQWPWPTRVAAMLGANDKAVCAAQQRVLTEFWKGARERFAMPKSELVFDHEYGSADLRERLLATRRTGRQMEPVTYSFPLGSEQHEAGTTPLGAMLNDDHEFRAIPGLSAVGPSLFPRTGAANPAMTILALSRRFAEKYADR
jgi:hypothetical protein